ncbi:hypothetical protein [Thalassoglobus sp.]|uniref:hypothetical protein n=1 Tax=Thalassoglobus sp. TaxID=2795869 RepID=UPI003AA9A2F3
MHDLPFPSSASAPAVPKIGSVTSIQLPWERVGPHEQPPMMFQVRFSNGRIVSFAYSDLREIRRRDAGHLTIGIYGLEKYQLCIEGRNLDELHSLLGMGKIKSIIEFGQRAFDQPEESACIEKIELETLTGPAPYSPT